VANICELVELTRCSDCQSRILLKERGRGVVFAGSGYFCNRDNKCLNPVVSFSSGRPQPASFGPAIYSTADRTWYY